MTDMELADRFKNYGIYFYRGMDDAEPTAFTNEECQQIIAALRRAPERPPSGEMVMGLLGFVESGLLTNSRDIHDWRSDMESIRDVLTDMLSAAEASKEAK